MSKVIVAISLALALYVGIWKWTHHRSGLHEADAPAAPVDPSSASDVDVPVAAGARDRGFVGVVVVGEPDDVAAKGERRLPALVAQRADPLAWGAAPPALDVRAVRRRLRGGRAHQPRVRFAVPEGRAGGVAVAQAVQVIVEPSGPTLLGTVTEVSEVDVASRMVIASAALELSPADARRLTTGVVVRVKLLGGG